MTSEEDINRDKMQKLINQKTNQQYRLIKLKAGSLKRPMNQNNLWQD